MSKTSTNLSLHERIREMAAQLQTALGYGSLSTMVEALIREEYERRNGPMTLKDSNQAPPPPPVQTTTNAAVYPKLTRAKRNASTARVHEPLSFSKTARKAAAKEIAAEERRTLSKKAMGGVP